MEENPQEKPRADKQGASILVIILGIALVAALIVIGALAVMLLVLRPASSEVVEDVATDAPPPAVTVVVPPGETVTPLPTVIVPTPEPEDPTGRVIAPNGVNIRTGPGSVYPIIYVAPFGTTSEITGRSADGQWWVAIVPGAPNNQGWVAAAYVDVVNGEDVPVVPAPPVPTPAATPTATATPAPEISFGATRTNINVGETSLLLWNVQNVSAVFVYPVGANYRDFPATGVDEREVQPFVTTTYELRAEKPDGTVELWQVVITVNGSLTSSRWILQSYNPGIGLTGVLPNTQLTALFDTSGALSGSAGCNTYNGSYSAFDNVLRIPGVTATRLSCDEAIMNQEADYLSLLTKARTFSIFGNQLSVRDIAGQTILVFIRG